MASTILSSFALFRRPATPGDRKAADAVATSLAREYELTSLYPAYIRQLASLPDGRHYFVAPAFARPAAVPPSRCLPASLRAERSKFVEQQRRRTVEAVYCLVEVRSGPTSAIGCEPFAAIDESIRVFDASDFLRQPIAELVPDGVSFVRIAYRGRAPILVPVTDNAFSFSPPPPPASGVDRQLKETLHKLLAPHKPDAQQRYLTARWNELLLRTDPTKIEWLTSSRAVIRTIEPPTPATYETTSIGDVRAPLEG